MIIPKKVVLGIDLFTPHINLQPKEDFEINGLIPCFLFSYLPEFDVAVAVSFKIFLCIYSINFSHLFFN
jgi:hypothetical protein